MGREIIKGETNAIEFAIEKSTFGYMVGNQVDYFREDYV
jgi:hypothetical protein